jgi:AsmA protein
LTSSNCCGGSNDGRSPAAAISAPAARRELDLKGTASLVTKTAAEPGFDLPFVVQGPWDDPIMLPDADILIRHSGAAAPLLNAMRERRSREALRSAIDRLTRRPTPAPAMTSAQPD